MNQSSKPPPRAEFRSFAAAAEPAGFDAVRFALNLAITSLSAQQQLALARRAKAFCEEVERHALERLGGAEREV